MQKVSLEKNSFKKVGPNKWTNDKCLITILEDCYVIQFTDAHVP